ncbi:MAG: HEAT repeat domain-containing protein [Kiritimatiellae bacterium]|nr:HEAT repeat domain-containing protein [Kiritimatiellia bacterium]
MISAPLIMSALFSSLSIAAEPFNLQTPVRNIKVVCDRWPDGSSLQQFALDAIRLSDAQTEKDKALAVLRWMRRWTMFTDGTPPMERGQAVLDEMKILHVYGAHWCDGRALCMENLWRSIGGRAYKLYVPDGYTMALVHWRDDDGVERWHQIHASRGWYVYDREGKWIATPDQIASDFSLMFRPSRTGIPRSGYPPRPWNWIAVGHRPFSQHDVSLCLQLSESYRRLWGNEGVPLCNNVSSNQYDDGEHGPYPITYGNGRFVSKVTVPERGLVKVDDTRSGVFWKLRLPHVMADAWIEGEFPEGTLAEFRPDETTRFPLAPPREGRIELGRRSSAEKNVLGRYEFPVLVSWPTGAKHPRELKLIVITQHNLFSLPQLWPGRNLITVSAELPPSVALRITYEWDDVAGQNKRNITVVEKAPHTYEIVAAGRQWEDVVCRSLNIEVVPATGQGNRTVEKEPGSPVEPLRPRPSMDEIVGVRQPPPLKTVAEYIEDLKNPELRTEALHGLMVLKDGSAAPALVELLYSEQEMDIEDRGRVCQAIYSCLPPPEAFEALLPVCRQDAKVKWIASSDGAGWRTISSLIAHLAGISGYRPAIPTLIEAYRHGVGRFNKPAYLRAFGRLKAKEALPLCVDALREHSDISASAAWALGEIGEPSCAPDLVRAVETRLGKVRFQAILYAEAAAALGKLGVRSPEAVALLEKLLGHEDEEVRGMAAEALGKVGSTAQAGLLKSCAQKEPFAWGAEKMLIAAEKLHGNNP